MAHGAKKINLSGSDRISNLPVTLLHHILSYLPADDMVQTCVLSKNWRNIWVSAPSLDFNNSVFVGQPSNVGISFEQFVDYLLLARGGSNIEKFSLNIEPEYDESDSEIEAETEALVKAKGVLDPRKVNAWILYALRHNVEIVELKSYVSLTPLLFSCESLKEIKLWRTEYDPDLPQTLNFPSSVNLPSLRVLHLIRVFIQAGQLDDALFSAMPCLETLNLDCCCFSQKKLSILSADKLTTLIMTGDLAHFELSISAPNLKCLKLGPGSFDTSMKIMRFRNKCIELIDANISVGISCSESTIELFEVLGHTSSLKLSSSFLKSFTRQLQNSLGIGYCIKAPFHNLMHMELGTVFSDVEALVINHVLYHSPRIEFLRILVQRNYPVIIGESFEAEEVWSEFKLSHLKLVEINDFQATANQIKFVKFLLENAIVLEDMIITTVRYGSRNKQEMKLVGKELLLYPRASSALVMQFG